MNKLLKIKDAIKIEKDAQVNINGGLSSNDCQSGCYTFFFCPGGGSGEDGHLCAVPSPSGATCFGAMQSGKCCI